MLGQWTGAPHLLTMTSGVARGRSFLIVNQASQRLTLATDGAELSALLAPGDRFDIRPAHTLAELFGTPPFVLRAGTEDAADLVGLWNGTSFQNFFHDGASWREVGVKGNRDGSIVFPDDGFFVTNRGSRPDALWLSVSLPEVPERWSSRSMKSLWPMNPPFRAHSPAAALAASRAGRARTW